MGAHLFLATTAHARLLPVDARIAFRYRLIFLGLDLAQLETAASDLPPLFRYDARALTSLRPSAYLDERDPRPVQVKLGELLTARGIASDKWAALVYLVTMPAYLGFEGINPLSVYFCYATVPATEDTSAGRQLTVVVLEVHNTFGERHTYILECGVSEDTPSSGYTHQWTFPRAFHVSPFNDRSGFYRVSLSDPLPAYGTSPDATLKLNIRLLTPEYESKLYASLHGHGAPLTSAVLVAALCKWPTTLLLTTPRILWQAGRLHYRKRSTGAVGLKVFPKPDPLLVETGAQTEEMNPVQRGAAVGHLGKLVEEGLDLLAKRVVLEHLSTRLDELANELGKRVQVIFAPGGSGIEGTYLLSAATTEGEQTTVSIQIDYFSTALWVDLISFPSVSLALEIASLREKRWIIYGGKEEQDLFLRIFSETAREDEEVAAYLRDGSAPIPQTTNWKSRFLHRIRLNQMRWGTSFAAPPSPSSPSTFDSLLSVSTIVDEEELHNPLTPNPSLSLIWNVVFFFFTVRLGYWIFRAVGAEFVQGMESWGEWGRWIDAISHAENVPGVTLVEEDVVTETGAHEGAAEAHEGAALPRRSLRTREFGSVRR